MAYSYRAGKLKKLSKNKKEKLKESIKKYLIIKSEFKNTKKCLLLNNEFTKAYDSLYKISERKFSFSDKVFYYKVFQTNRNNKKVKYLDLLKELKNKPSRKLGYEQVFASKMLHTINNKWPILDKNAFRNLTGYKLNEVQRKKKYCSYTTKNDWHFVKNNRVLMLSNIYDKYCEDIKTNILKNAKIKCNMINDFDDFVVNSNLSQKDKNNAIKINTIKKIDFILWIL